MIHVNLKFAQTDQIVRFVRIMNRYDINGDIRCGSRVVDAKSVMGVLALAKHHDVELILHTEECTSLLQDIAPYAA
ncbi:HPr family phosphocarrier protein [Enterocloster bolteae]|jgi:phosphocarrier protein HPr|uniref:HPr family phosphocarrier protein n=1 Tax=Enterocloster bolteae TaxID=208479 RepID=UPI002A8182CE|nr:HPr family phosphocarrier protein [Enterocloster bolteae]